MTNNRGLIVMPPSVEFGNARAYAEYCNKGDPFFREGLTFDEFINQRDGMLKGYQANAQTQPNFYNTRMTKFDGARDE